MCAPWTINYIQIIYQTAYQIHPSYIQIKYKLHTHILLLLYLGKVLVTTCQLFVCLSNWQSILLIFTRLSSNKLRDQFSPHQTNQLHNFNYFLWIVCSLLPWQHLPCYSHFYVCITSHLHKDPWSGYAEPQKDNVLVNMWLPACTCKKGDNS